MKKNPYFSIIIPIRIENKYLSKTLKKLKNQTFKNYEVLVITDKISKSPNPAYKRNLGSKIAKGKYLCFIDDDSYPDKNWLKNIHKLTTKHSDYSGFCGPCLTPPDNNIYQKASGLVWTSILGSGGAGVYRNSIKKARFVDDYPSVNLIIKKLDFKKVNGFDVKYWPGEDTILCLKLTHNLDKKIYYHPSILTFHHRRNILIPHLKQISRYALHRGHFVKIFPKTSFRIGYFIPSIFTLYLFSLPIHQLFLPIYLYIFLLIFTFLSFLFTKNNFLLSILATISIPISHIVYGLYFLKGLIKRNIYFTPHKINKKTGQYIGG